MFDYDIPFRSDLRKDGYVPFRVNKRLVREVEMFFCHPRFPHREVFIAVNRMRNGMVAKEMANHLFGYVKHYKEFPQQYGHSLDNIKLAILVRMWKILFKWLSIKDDFEIEGYKMFPSSMLKHSDKLFEEAIRSVDEDDCKWTEVKERVLPKVVYDHATGKKIDKNHPGYSRGRVSMYGTEEGTKNFKKLLKLAEDEIGSLL